ncbi:MAG: porin family protein [Candidatus Krumholzibacteriia bacterium]
MRHLAFCSVVVVVMLVAAQATAGPLGKGIKAGITYTQVTNDILGDSDHTMGFAAGFTLNYQLAPGIAVQPEVLYVQQGGKYDVLIADQGVPIGRAELTWDLDYVQVPVLARVSLPVIGSFLPSIVVGPALAFKVSSEFSRESGDVELETGELEDIGSTDLSLIAGVAFKIGAGPAGVTVDARYNLGLSNVYDGDGTAEIKNRGFQVLAGIAF